MLLKIPNFPPAFKDCLQWKQENGKWGHKIIYTQFPSSLTFQDEESVIFATKETMGTWKACPFTLKVSKCTLGSKSLERRDHFQLLMKILGSKGLPSNTVQILEFSTQRVT